MFTQASISRSRSLHIAGYRALLYLLLALVGPIIGLDALKGCRGESSSGYRVQLLRYFWEQPLLLIAVKSDKRPFEGVCRMSNHWDRNASVS